MQVKLFAKVFPPLCCVLLAVLSARAAELLSVDSTGARSANSGVEELFCVSGDGRLAAFSSLAANIIEPDTNGIGDVFVRDCALRSNVWSTVNTLPSGAGPGSYPVQFTPDGSKLLFVSRATNLVAGATAPVYQLYLRDFPSNTTRLVSVSSDGTNASATAITTLPSQPRISVDGRYIGFSSTATDLVAGVDTGTAMDVFCRDMEAGLTELITASPEGLALDYATWKYSMSTNGRWFAFETRATNVVAGMLKTNTSQQVYRRDRQTGVTELVSSDVTGGFCSSPASLMSMSGDGRYVSFECGATNVVADQNDVYGLQDLFIRDMLAGETWLVSRATNGYTTSFRVSGGEFSANGQWMLVAPCAADLVPDVLDINGVNPDLCAHHVPSRTNNFISLSLSGLTGCSSAVSDGFAHISSSGRFVIFSTMSTNLVSGGTNSVHRLLVRDQQADRTINPLRTEPFVTTAYNTARFVFSDDERYIFFLASANYDPAVTDANGAPDLFRAPLYEPRFLRTNTLTAEGLAFATYVLQVSSNMMDWADAATNSADGSGIWSGDDPAPGGLHRFYRLRLEGQP